MLWDMTNRRKLTSSMGSVVPNANCVAFGTRARISVSCRPALRNIKATTDPLGAAAREADSEGSRLSLAHAATV
jgi:hypothetical protein